MPGVTHRHALTKDAAPPPAWHRPDPALAAAGIEGEFVVAQVRVVAMSLLMIAPTYNLVHFGDQPMHRAGFLVTFAATLASYGIWLLLRGGRWRPWVGFASSLFDVSMVSLALLSFLLVSSPLVALNSTVTFEMYFLALGATSLRYDPRICVVVGIVALLQYGGLWAYAETAYDLADPAYVAAAGPYLPVDLWTRLILLAIATLLSIAIVRRAQRLLYLASRDRLTGLYNRGHFDRALESAIEQAGRLERPLSLALLDIDHFKRINDMHGHAAGDRALQEVASLLVRSMRRTDVVGRYGGEEFAILMPGTSREAALARIESLRLELAETPLDLGTSGTLMLGFSAGVAGTPADMRIEDAKTFVALADRRLFAAKRAGRARSVGAGEDAAA